MTDRDLIARIEQVRAHMNAQLDELVAAIQQGKQPGPKRRAPMRPPLGGPVLLTTDIVRAKAQAALQRMRLTRVRG